MIKESLTVLIFVIEENYRHNRDCIFGNLSLFKAVNLTIWLNINCVNLFVSKNILSRRKRNKLPCLVLVKNLHFINHGLLSSRMVKCARYNFRDRAIEDTNETKWEKEEATNHSLENCE